MSEICQLFKATIKNMFFIVTHRELYKSNKIVLVTLDTCSKVYKRLPLKRSSAANVQLGFFDPKNERVFILAPALYYLSFLSYN